MSRMTMRERMLAFVRRRPYDRVPFVQYDNMAAPNEEIWAELGRENLGLMRWCTPFECPSPNCRFIEVPFEQDGRKGFRRTLQTPVGEVFEDRIQEPTYGTYAFRSHFIKQPADYAVLMSYLRDITVVPKTDYLKQIFAELGEDGLPHTCVGRTAFQKLWIEYVGLDDFCFHLADEPALIEEVIALLNDLQRRQNEAAITVCKELPVPYLILVDNITAPVIGEQNFRRYCLPMYRQLAEMLDAAGLDLPIFVHMDGDLKPLWGAIGESAVRGLDSFSPAPDTDTTVAEAVTMWPEMRVGLNFPSVVHLRSEAEIYAEARKILAEGGRNSRIQIQISENIPPGLWRKSFPPIIRAITEFGAP